MERGETELESETARLREIERDLEQARSEHYASGDALSAAKGELYGVNADVSRLETEIRFVADTRQPLDAQLAQLRAQRDAGRQSEAEQRDARLPWAARRQESRDALEKARRNHPEEQLTLRQR